MTETEQLHDTRIIDSAVIDAEVEAHNRDVANRRYCKVCNVAVRSEDYKGKFAGAGGVIVGPFSSDDCRLGWLFGVYDDE